MDIGTLWGLMQTVVSQAPPEAPAGITGQDIKIAAACIGAGLAIAFGTLGAGLGEGFAAGKACEGVARNPDTTGLITRTMLIGQAVAESNAIYALVIALLILVFVVM